MVNSQLKPKASFAVSSLLFHCSGGWPAIRNPLHQEVVSGSQRSRRRIRETPFSSSRGGPERARTEFTAS